MAKRRVALVVTGRLELEALPAALARLFPGVSFEIASTLEKESLRDSTSTRVDPLRNQECVDDVARRAATSGAKPTTIAIDELIGHLAGCITGKQAADFAVLIEDLELCNRNNEPNVIEAVRQSVRRHLGELGKRSVMRGDVRELETAFQARASFHLLDPMVEAYFFDERRALERAGVPTSVSSQRSAVDPERFSVAPDVEPEYFAPVGECDRHRRPKERRCPWDGDDRAEHPKKYLKYLCREAPPHEFCSTYKETRGGVAALRDLDWSSVLGTNGSSPYLRALIEDLEDALGVSPNLPGWPNAASSNAITARSGAPRERCLRNL